MSIKPHGSDTLNPLFVRDDDERDALIKEAEGLPSIVISSAAAGNAVMLGSGYFNPLTGFMNVADAMAVAKDMHTTSGLFWPTPVLNVVKDASAIKGAKRIALRDPNVDGNPVLAIMDVEAIEEITAEQMAYMTDRVFRTDDTEHPGVANFNGAGNTAISGSIRVLNYSYFAVDFPDTFRTAYQIRDEIQIRGWKKVIAFQTRNPMHRAHEEVCRMGYEAEKCDGILIHMLLGKLKKGDIPGDVRDAAIRKMVEVYFPQNTVMVTGYGFDMLYAGPREAVLHAVFRQNCGCAYLVVGRDHAGVGSYYGGFDAQTIFHEEVKEGEMQIKIFEADHTCWSHKLKKIIMMRDAPDHGKEDWLFLSGTKVRTMLAAGEALPAEFARPEVAEILQKFYMSEAD